MTLCQINIDSTNIEGVKILTPGVYGDERGFFMESWNKKDFAQVANITFIQDNQSRSKKGVVRGLHFQLPPHAQAKLVRCIVGSIFDVAVDIRRSSPTFGQWVGFELSAENKKTTLDTRGIRPWFCSSHGLCGGLL